MVVETRAPRNETPGCAVPPRTAHYVHGEEQGPCKFLIVQGIGVFRFRPGRGRSNLDRLRAQLRRKLP